MHHISQTLRRLLIGCILLYTGMLVILTILWQSPAASFSWLPILNIFALYLFVPLVLLIPLAVYMRSWLLRGAVLVVGVLFLWLFGVSLTPPSEQLATEETITVATFNMLFTNQNSDALISAIQSSEADLVGLQELAPHAATAIDQQLAQSYPYQLLAPSGGADGLGILSRYPFEVAPQTQAVPWQHVILNVNGQQIDLLNIHFIPPHIATRAIALTSREVIVPDYSTDKRDQQMVHALHTIDAIHNPLIVLGDFNISDREHGYAQFDQRLHDAYRETAWGFGFTFPNKAAMVRIDYVWSNGGIMPLAAQVDCTTTGSDHCMVLADLGIDPALTGLLQPLAPAEVHAGP